MSSVGFISSSEFVQHDTGARHPERPDRLRAIHRALRQSRLLVSADPFPEFSIDFGHPLPMAAEPLIELPLRTATDTGLLLCHAPEHIARISRAIATHQTVLDAGDTVISARSDELARMAAGAALSAVDAVLDSTVNRCFVAGRPPGHHAEPNRAMGFCLYSNIALAARHAVQRRGVGRVAIVDFDVHHGNGTQACIAGDGSVLFISLHQHPQTCYPGTGFEWETGVGAGKGLTVNLPLPPGSGDAVYLKAFDEQVLPKLAEFGPELLLVSAGFDAHVADPLADMEVTDDGFAAMARKLFDAVPRSVSILEGGYNLAALGRCVVRHVMEMRAR